MVSIAAMVMMVVSMLWGIAIPVGLFIYGRKKLHASPLAFFLGCAVWFFFTQVLEALMHQLVLAGPMGAAIQEKIFLYAIYGGLAAGIFEEVGRFVGMKFFMKKLHGYDQNALMYGFGHGGFEAAFILVIGMINNLVYSVMINAGQMSLLTNQVPEEARGQLEAVVEQLISTNPMVFGAGMLERVSAVLLHIGFSVIVWIAVTRKKTGLLFLSIFLHAFADASMVLVASVAPVWLVEVLVLALALLVCFLAKKLWEHNGCQISTEN